MGDLIRLFPQSNPAASTPAPDLSLSSRPATPPHRDVAVSPDPIENVLNKLAFSPDEPPPIVILDKISRRSAAFLTRLTESRVAKVGIRAVHAKNDFKTLIQKGPRAVEVERLTRAFERETSAHKMQISLEQIAALGEEGVQRLAALYKTAVMRASHADMVAELRRKTLATVLTHAVRERLASFSAPENILDQMAIALMSNNRPTELKLIAECFIASGVLGERHFKTIFQSGGIENSPRGERNFDRFTIAAELYLRQLQADLDAEKSDDAAAEMRRDFKLTLECLRSLSENALDSDLRCRALELIFELRCRLC